MLTRYAFVIELWRGHELLACHISTAPVNHLDWHVFIDGFSSRAVQQFVRQFAFDRRTDCRIVMKYEPLVVIDSIDLDIPF